MWRCGKICYQRVWLLPAITSSPKTQISGPLADMPAAICWVTSQPPQERNGYERAFLLIHGMMWPGLIPQSPKDKEYKQKNYTKQCYMTKKKKKERKYSSYHHPIPNWPIPRSKSASTVAKVPTALCIAGHQSGL